MICSAARRYRSAGVASSRSRVKNPNLFRFAKGFMRVFDGPVHARSVLLLAVLVKASPGFAAEIAGIDHLLEQRRGPVFRFVEALIEDVHHRQHGVETDEIGQRQWPDRMIASELHAGVDLL